MPAKAPNLALAAELGRLLEYSLLSCMPNDPAQQPAGLSELRIGESRHAPPVCCSAWLGPSERRLSSRRMRERQNGSHDSIEGHCGHDLVRCALPQQRFDPLEMFQHFRQFFWIFPVRVLRPPDQSLSDDINGGTHQDDVAELRVEFHLILGAAAHEQVIGSVGCQYRSEPIFTPHLIAFGVMDRPARFVHIDGRIASRPEFTDDTGLAHSRHPGQ